MNTVGEHLLISLMQFKIINGLIIKLLPNHYQYRPGSKRFSKINGIAFELEISNWNDWEVYFHAHDKSMNELLSICCKDEYIIDVGANIGYVLMNIALRVGDDGMVFGFEPHPMAFSKLVKNIKLNDLKNVHFEQLAIGNSIGKIVPYTVNELNLGMNKVRQSFTGSNDDVVLTTLDKYCDDNNVSKVDLIKIDVEGYEMKVLEGAEHILQKFRPKLFIEISGENLAEQNSSPLNVIEFLSSRDYTIIRADNNVVVTSSYKLEPDCHFNIICIPTKIV